MKKRLNLLIKIFIIWNIAVWSASTLYDVFSPGANEVEQILCQEWNNGEGITDDSMMLTKKFFIERGIQLVYGKKYPFYVEYISNANITPKTIIEKFERKGYVVKKYYGNPSMEAVFELKKIRGSYKDNLSCTVYIRNNTELVIKYQYTT